MTEAIMGRGETVVASGIQTNYHEAGSGPTVILLHGSGPGVSAWTNWKNVLPILSEDFHVLAPDMAGFGFTERKADLEFDMKLWVRHLLAFMDELGVEKASLMGNSFGGSLALAAAARHPGRFERLVLMGTPCDKFAMTPGLRAGWDYEPGRDAMRAAMSHFPFDPTFITDELVEDRYLTSLIPGAQQGLRKLLAKPSEEGETILSGMPAKVVEGIKLPTLVLHGTEDKVIPVEMGILLARTMPNADLHMFGRCGHWVQAERFREFVSLTSAHLKGADQ